MVTILWSPIFIQNKHLLPRQSQRTFYRNFIDILKIGHGLECPNSKTSSYFSPSFSTFSKREHLLIKYYFVVFLYYISSYNIVVHNNSKFLQIGLITCSGCNQYQTSNIGFYTTLLQGGFIPVLPPKITNYTLTHFKVCNFFVRYSIQYNKPNYSNIVWSI